jgi:metal-responsive CopG/Arc/MetJ family transcriptional regulator
MKTTTKVRLNLQLSQSLNATLDEIAESNGTTRAEVIRVAFALLKLAHDAKHDGMHLGLARDANKLDSEFIYLL